MQIDLQAKIEWEHEPDDFITTVEVGHQRADPEFFQQVAKMLVVGGYEEVILKSPTVTLTYSRA